MDGKESVESPVAGGDTNLAEMAPLGGGEGIAFLRKVVDIVGG